MAVIASAFYLLKQLKNTMKKQKTQVEKTLDLLGTASIIVFFSSIILKIWTEDDIQWILNRLWLTSLLIFIFILVFYGFVIHEPDDKD